MNAAYEFRRAIQSANLTPPENIVPDGKLHRFSSNGKRGDDSGWYLLHDDGVPAGAFGDWRSDLSRTWRADIGRDLTPAEMAAHQARVDAACREREAEKAREHVEASRKAAEIWKTSTPTSSTHPYLARKRIAPVESLRDIDAAEAARILGYAPKSGNEPLAGRLLVVPIKVASELSSVEFIDEAGRKSALYGGAKAGGYWAAQELPDGDGAGLTLLIGEGVATVLSAREATGYLVIAALSCGNLLVVAREMRKRLPAAKLGILADLGNGKDKAEEAARATSSVLVLPDFGPKPPGGLTDFNDMHQHRGREAVAECIRRQMAASSAQNGTPPGSEDAPGSDSRDKPRDGQGEAPGSAKASSGGQTRPDSGTAPGDAEVIETAIAKLSIDIGAIFEPEVITALKAVRESNPADYQRYRKRIKDAGASVAELDRLVCVPEEKGDDAQGAPVLFPHIEPSPEPVDGAKLLTDLAATCRRYVVLTKYADTAIALWVVFTHAIGFVDIAPILAITSPEKRCGKSTVLAMLMRLVLRPLPAANLTAAALFRAIQAWAPTLLIDEADTFTQNSDELRGVINSGHTRELAYVIRTVGDDHEPRRFSTWGAKAIASIGKLSDTNADRSIEIPLQRKLPGERTERLRHANPATFHNLASRCVRWVMHHAEEIRAARPSMPETLHDRAQDNWEPLIAIAGLAGGDWPKLACEAALALSGDKDIANDNIRVQLLSDIRDVFMDRGPDCDRLPTVELIADLIALEGRPWGEANRRKPINPHWLAARLRPFRIVRGTKRSEKVTFKGYTIDQFKDAFKRYLPPLAPEPHTEDPPSDPSKGTPPSEDPPSDRSHGHNVGGARVAADFGKVTPEECDRSENAPEPSCGAGCDRVTDLKPSTQGDGDDRSTTHDREGGRRVEVEV